MVIIPSGSREKARWTEVPLVEEGKGEKNRLSRSHVLRRDYGRRCIE
jgi:hypothetical protein